MTAAPLACATCGGRGRIWLEPPGASNFFPKRGGRWEECRDCMGTGLCPIGEPAQEFDYEFEVDDRGQIRRIQEEP
jgi:hypothetical protein